MDSTWKAQLISIAEKEWRWSENDEFPERWPLGATAACLPPPPYELMAQEIYEEDVNALRYWYRLNYYVALQHEKGAPHLPLAEKHWFLYQLLHDWWTARYSDTAFPRATIFELITRFEEKLYIQDDNSGAVEAKDLVMAHLRLTTWFSGDKKDAPSDNVVESYHYHERLRILFEHHFARSVAYSPLDDTEHDRFGRQQAQERAAVSAYCQQLAWKVYTRDVLKYLNEAQDARNSRKNLSDVDRFTYNIEDHGPVWKPCPWLDEDIDDLNNLPRYLWDRSNACTIRVAELPFSPAYVVISHTWGRWMLDQDGQPPGRPIPVDGVPWKVPQNSRFKVENLAEELLKVPGGTPYIWLDLLCIPQDDSSIEKTLEIGRQARIFASAKFAMAWFNDVESFEFLGKAIEYQALQTLVISGNESEHLLGASVDAAWNGLNGLKTGLLNYHEDGQKVALFEDASLNPWYTSLWTLQELCLRPDMWLCAKDWSFLSYADVKHKTPITIGGFVAVFNIWSSFFPIRRTVWTGIDLTKPGGHVALFEIDMWRVESGLDKFLDLDRTTIITLGDRRICRERRAEAIMSVLGMTKWYEQALVKYGTPKALHEYLEKDLVLGKYPADFVNVLAKEMPRDFFATFYRLNLGYKKEASLRDNKAGSMMPFSRFGAWYSDNSPLRRSRIPTVTHASLQYWTVEKNGAVHMPTACILSSKDIAANAIEIRLVLPAQMTWAKAAHGVSATLQLPEYMRVNGKLGDLTGSNWIDLHAWIAQTPHEAFAVITEYCVYPSFNQTSREKVVHGGGIILERIDGQMSKTWHFNFVDETSKSAHVLMGATRVNWIVS